MNHTEIIALYQKGLGYAAIARMYGVSRQCIEQLINRRKLNARQTLNDAIGSGKIKAQPCTKCGDTNAEAHHENYEKPLDVVWLCHKHHMEIHSGRAYRTASKRQPAAVEVTK